jgi:predicted permease
MLATEALVIGTGAGISALLLSVWTTRALERINLLPGLTLRLPAEADARVVTFTAAAALFASLVLAAVGTLQVVRHDVTPALKDNGPAAVAGGRRGRLRGALVGVQITVSLLLVIGAALFVRGARAAAAIEPGFDPRGVVVLDLDATAGRSAAESLRLFRTALQQLNDASSVVAAALSTRAPLDSSTPLVRISARAAVEAGNGDSPTVTYLVVSSRFFEVVRTPIASGRPFTDEDDVTRTPVVIVNESLAARLWPNGDAIGRRLWLESRVSTTPCVVVGVARDSKYLSLADERQGHVYLPFAQHPRRGTALLIRSIDPPERAIRDARNLLHAVDPTLEGFFARTLVEHVAVSTLPVRLAAKLAAAIAALALALAVVGLYSLLSFLVIDRTHELGLRMALGATAGDVMRLVIAHGLRLTLAGLMVGLSAAVAGTRLLRTLLFGVSPVDPATFIAASAAVVIVATIASALPAWRAMRLSPMRALRS